MQDCKPEELQMSPGDILGGMFAIEEWIEFADVLTEPASSDAVVSGSGSDEDMSDWGGFLF